MTVRTSIRVEPCRLIEIARKDRTVTDDEPRKRRQRTQRRRDVVAVSLGTDTDEI